MLALTFLAAGLYIVIEAGSHATAPSGAAQASTVVSLPSRESALPSSRTAAETDISWDDLPVLQARPLEPEDALPQDEAQEPGTAIAGGEASVLPAAALVPAAPAPLPPTTSPPAPVPTATPRPAPTSPASAAAGLSSLEQQLFDGQNAERARAGVPPLRVDSGLMAVARHRASDMATGGYFSHTSPTGETAFSLIAAAGIYAPYAGENIGYNTYGDATSASSILAAFMSSPGHRANILNGNYTRVGVGVAVSSSGTKYFAVVFAGP